METLSRNKALLEIIRQGLEYSGIQNSISSLGDRTSYLGLSDLAKYSECPRAAMAAKVQPQQNSLNQLLTMQRGHWFESGLTDCFKNLDLNFMPQMEISINHADIPIRCHLDFTFVWEKPEPAVRIIEVKSVSRLSKEPYPAHLFQARAQVCLLQKYWNEPAFSLKGTAGEHLFANLTFPEICRRSLGIILSDNPRKISVESWLLCLSMKEAVCFGPFVYDESIMADLLKMAEKAWGVYGLLRNNALTLDSLSCVSGYQPLCDYCLHSFDCPKFRSGDFQPEWEETIRSIEALKKEKEETEHQIKNLETQLKQAYEASDCKDWIEAGSYRFRVTNTAGRRILDRKSLQMGLVELFDTLGIDDLDVNAWLEKHEKTGAPSSRLNIMKFN